MKKYWNEIRVGCCILGAMMCLWGVFRINRWSGASSDAVTVDLAQLESGLEPTDMHVQIGEHHAAYRKSAYAHSGPDTGFGIPASSDQKVEYVYYPVVSLKNPYVKEHAEKVKKWGDLNRIPVFEKGPVLREFSVLVKTKRFHTVGNIPERDKVEQSVKGVMLRKASELEQEERNQLSQQYPGITGRNVYILEAGREPASGLVSALIILFGLAQLAGGVVMFLKQPE